MSEIERNENPYRSPYQQTVVGCWRNVSRIRRTGLWRSVMFLTRTASVMWLLWFVLVYPVASPVMMVHTVRERVLQTVITIVALFPTLLSVRRWWAHLLLFPVWVLVVGNLYIRWTEPAWTPDEYQQEKTYYEQSRGT
jgi:hypothetical protein